MRGHKRPGKKKQYIVQVRVYVNPAWNGSLINFVKPPFCRDLKVEPFFLHHEDIKNKRLPNINWHWNIFP